MKKLSYLILITLVSTSLFACGGSSDEGGSFVSSDDIVAQDYLTGSSISEEPSVSLETSDVAQITCGANDNTEGGGTTVSCLDNDGHTTLTILFVCETGSISWSDSEVGSVVDTCVKVLCKEDGNGATVKTCDGSDIASSSTSENNSTENYEDCVDMESEFGDEYTDEEMEQGCVNTEGSYSNGYCCWN